MNPVNDFIEFVDNLIVGESQHTYPEFIELGFPTSIILFSFIIIMDFSINFNDQFIFMAIEIDYKNINRVLSAEFTKSY